MKNVQQLLKQYQQGERFFSMADLNGANLNGADLSMADLNGADLNGANLHGADLSMADLNGANLHGADLSMADLNGADLNGANLHGANLSGAQGPFEYSKGGSGYMLIFVHCQDYVKIQSGCRHFHDLAEAKKHWHLGMNRSQVHIADVLEALAYLEQRCKRKGWPI